MFSLNLYCTYIIELTFNDCHPQFEEFCILRKCNAEHKSVKLDSPTFVGSWHTDNVIQTNIDSTLEN